MRAPTPRGGAMVYEDPCFGGQIVTKRPVLHIQDQLYP
jgi:hypothetical protein